MNKNKSHSNVTPKVVGALVISAVVASGVYVFLFKNGQPPKSTDSAGSPAPATSDALPQDTSTTSSSNYKSGVYSASATYEVPKSSNIIQVELVLNNDIVESVSTTHKLNSADSKSAVYLDDFDAAITGQVVGKKINDLNLSRVGGASLTTDGFNAALSDIVKQASS